MGDGCAFDVGNLHDAGPRAEFLSGDAALLALRAIRDMEIAFPRRLREILHTCAL